MSLVQDIERDFRESFKKRDRDRTETLKMLKAALKNKAIDERVSESDLGDAEALAVLKHEIKKRREAVEAYTIGNRQDLARRESSELEILQRYQPPQMGEADIDTLVAEVAREHDMAEPYNFGQLMSFVMARVKGQADGALVRERVQRFIEAR